MGIQEDRQTVQRSVCIDIIHRRAQIDPRLRETDDPAALAFSDARRIITKDHIASVNKRRDLRQMRRFAVAHARRDHHQSGRVVTAIAAACQPISS